MLMLMSNFAFAADWYNSDWKMSDKIQISGIGSDVPNQTIIIMLNSSFQYENTTNNLSDIRFTDDQNETEYSYWRDFINLTGYSYIYLQIPNLSQAISGTMNIYMYFNNSAVSTTESSSIFTFYENCNNVSDWTTDSGLFTAQTLYYVPDPRGENYGCLSNSTNNIGFSSISVIPASLNAFAFDLWSMKNTYATSSTIGRGMFMGIDNGSTAQNNYPFAYQRWEAHPTINYSSVGINTTGGVNYRSGLGDIVINSDFWKTTMLINFTNNWIVTEINASTSDRNNVVIWMGTKGTATAHPTINEISVQAPDSNDYASAYWDEIKIYNATYPFPIIEILETSYSQEADSVPPTVTIINPLNASNFSMQYFLNFTASDASGIDKCWYINTTGVNQSLPSCQNTSWVEGIDGIKTIIVFANDTAGNTGNASVTFTKVSYPTWSLNSTNNTEAGKSILHSVYWQTYNAGSSLDGYIFNFCNNYNAINGYCGETTSTEEITKNIIINATNHFPVSSIKDSIVKDSKGYLWVSYFNDNNAFLFNSIDNGTSWNYVGNINSTKTILLQDFYSMAINSTDSLLFAWGTGSNVYFRSYDTDTSTWNIPVYVSGSSGHQLGMAVNETDAIIIIHSDGSSTLFSSFSNDGGLNWTTNSIGGHAVGLQIEIDSNNLINLARVYKPTSSTLAADYLNSTDAITYNNYGVFTPSPFNNSGMTVDLYRDFNGNLHIIYTGNPNCNYGGGCLEVNKMFYLNITRSGVISTAYNITDNSTFQADISFFAQLNNTDLYILTWNWNWASGYGEKYNASFYMKASINEMSWSGLNLINNNTRYIIPRGTIFPVTNRINSNLIEFTEYAVNSSSYNFLFGNISLSGIEGNNSWETDSFVHFSNGWSNVTKISNETVGTVIAWYVSANTSFDISNSTPLFQYNTTEAAVIPPVVTGLVTGNDATLLGAIGILFSIFVMFLGLRTFMEEENIIKGFMIFLLGMIFVIIILGTIALST